MLKLGRMDDCSCYIKSRTMLNDIIFLCVMCLAYVYWFNAEKAKEIALATAETIAWLWKYRCWMAMLR